MNTQLSEAETAFLQDLDSTRRSWLNAVDAALTAKGASEWTEHPDAWAKLAARLDRPEDRAAMVTIVEEILSGLTHSFLATLDGATSLAETTQLEVRGSDGHVFKRYLHEYWPQLRETEA